MNCIGKKISAERGTLFLIIELKWKSFPISFNNIKSLLLDIDIQVKVWFSAKLSLSEIPIAAVFFSRILKNWREKKVGLLTSKVQKYLPKV